MKIAFIGARSGFDYSNIGGVENYVRRVSKDLINRGCSVDMFFLDSFEQKEINIGSGLTLHYIIENRIVIRQTLADFDVVIPVYMSLFSRLYFLYQCILNCKRKSVIKVLFNWQDSKLKRLIYFYEAFMLANRIICISNRQFEYMEALPCIQSSKTYLLPPPIPSFYYGLESTKISCFDSDLINVVFVGRLDFGKGIDEVIAIMSLLSKNSMYRCSIYGIHFPDDSYGLKIHNDLSNQNIIDYYPVERSKFSEDIEHNTGHILSKADIFLQPYKNISSTVDAPLLIYEAMAALCVVVTRNVGDVEKIIGSNNFIIPDIPEKEFIIEATERIKSIDMTVFTKEVLRLSKRNKLFRRASIIDVILSED